MDTSYEYMTAVQKYGQERVDRAIYEYSTKDFDGDSVVTPTDILNCYTEEYCKTINTVTRFRSESMGIAREQGSVFEKYAGDDKILSKYEYIDALYSPENQMCVSSYNNLVKDYNEYISSFVGDKSSSTAKNESSISSFFNNIIESVTQFFCGDENTTKEA